jgi:hypothetical protein
MNVMGRVEFMPTSNDLAIADLVYRSLAGVRDAGRLGDRKVFVSALWVMMLLLDAESGSGLTTGCTIEDFKTWLLRSRRITRDGSEAGAPLVVLARADFVAAMDPAVVAASEITTDGATFHFVLDPATAPEVYAPRMPARRPILSTKRGQIGATRRSSVRYTG